MKRYSLEDIRARKSETDWERLKREGDHEGPAEIDIDWSTARVESPANKKLISLRLDADVLEFFRSSGKGYQTRMNAVLRSYMDAKRKP